MTMVKLFQRVALRVGRPQLLRKWFWLYRPALQCVAGKVHLFSRRMLLRRVERFTIVSVAALLSASPSLAQMSRQETHGWCSPAVADVKGNVVINCQGVDPKALQRMNELLDKKDVELSKKIDEANEWARQYHELSERLAGADDSLLSRQAVGLIEDGNFEAAGQLLDRLIAQQEQKIDLVAANHFSRGQLFELEGKQREALPHYEKAYRYRPNQFEHIVRYAKAIQWNGSSKQSRSDVDYLKVHSLYLDAFRVGNSMVGPNLDHAKFRPAVLNAAWQAFSFYSTSSPVTRAERGDVRAVYEQIATLYRRLSAPRPDEYLADGGWLAAAFARQFLETHRYSEAEAAAKDAVAAFRVLAVSPGVYRDALALSLEDLGVAYFSMERWAESEASLIEAVSIFRAANGGIIGEDRVPGQPARLLGITAALYARIGRLEAAKDAYHEALANYRRTLAKDPKETTAIMDMLTRLLESYREGRKPDQARDACADVVEFFNSLDQPNGASYAGELFMVSRLCPR